MDETEARKEAQGVRCPPSPSFPEVLKVWIKIGLLSFGGPAGQIGLMHTELVEKRRWISDRRFLHALNYCMLLPGPEAQQLAIYTGWLLHRVPGGVVAGALFVLPGALLMFAISWVYVAFGDVPVMEAVFYGLKAAVMAIVVAALIRIGRKILNRPLLWALSAAAFVGIFFLNIPFPAIILSALIFGLIVGHRAPLFLDASVNSNNDPAGDDAAGYVISDAVSDRVTSPKPSRTVAVTLLWAALWLAPLAICLATFGRGHLLTEEGVFFAKAALVTFGGAYAVLPYVAQQAVEVHGWLSAAEMMDGLGLAETTPGPLILVLQFVGFLGGWTQPQGFSPLAMAVLASGLTSWMIFVPGCLFVFAGGPYIERTRGNPLLNRALTAVTAAVVGVILNLAIWFGWNVIVTEADGFNAGALGLAAVFFLLLYWRKWDVLPVVGLGAALGLLLYMAGLGIPN